MSFLGIVGSVLVATILAQAMGLLIVGGLQREPIAIGALPMTLVFFALPAFIWSAVVVLAAHYGLKLIGGSRFVPLAVGMLAILLLAKAGISPPKSFSGEAGGYNQAVGLNIIGALAVWAIYAQVRMLKS